jgi:hypothetical protein
LRGQEEFRRFESECLPAARPVPVRPRQIVRLTASRYSVLLCRQCATSLQAVWRERATRKGDVEIRELLQWWRDEQGAWELARELVHHHRHWQTRVRVIAEMQRFVARNGGRRFRVRHPRYADQPIEGDAVAVNRAAGQEIHFGDLRFNTLAKVLGPCGGEPLPGLGAWMAYLVALDAAGTTLDKGMRKRLADNRAAAWGALQHVFGERLPTAEAHGLEEQFREAIERRFRDSVEALVRMPPPARTGRFDRERLSGVGQPPHGRRATG